MALFSIGLILLNFKQTFPNLYSMSGTLHIKSMWMDFNIKCMVLKLFGQFLEIDI